MNDLKPFILYGTEGCHLCKEAENILKGLRHRCCENFDWDSIDIVTSDLLFEKYGTAIPVVYHSGSRKELHWPFSVDELLEFVIGCPISPI